MSTPKTCATCAHKTGLTTEFGKCAKTGYYVEVQRRYADVHCNSEFSGWSPRPGLLVRIKAFFIGWEPTP